MNKGIRKILPGEIPTHQTLPWKIPPPGKFPPRKFTPGIFPPIFSNILFFPYYYRYHQYWLKDCISAF